MAKKAFPLRLDPKLYDALRRWAESEFRSVNGQIEYVLRHAVIRRFGKLEFEDETPPETGGEGRRETKPD